LWTWRFILPVFICLITGWTPCPFILSKGFLSRMNRIFVFGYEVYPGGEAKVSTYVHALMFDYSGAYLGDAAQTYPLDTAIPTDAHFDSLDHLHLLYRMERKMKVFDPEGNLISQWNIPQSQLVQEELASLEGEYTPAQIETESNRIRPAQFVLDEQGQVYVANYLSIQVFTATGVLLKEWLAADEYYSILGAPYGNPESGLNDLVLDGSGAISVLHPLDITVNKFNSDGHKLAEWNIDPNTETDILCLGTQGRY